MKLLFQCSYYQQEREFFLSWLGGQKPFVIFTMHSPSFNAFLSIFQGNWQNCSHYFCFNIQLYILCMPVNTLYIWFVCKHDLLDLLPMWSLKVAYRAHDDWVLLHISQCIWIKFLIMLYPIFYILYQWYITSLFVSDSNLANLTAIISLETCSEQLAIAYQGIQIPLIRVNSDPACQIYDQLHSSVISIPKGRALHEIIGAFIRKLHLSKVNIVYDDSMGRNLLYILIPYNYYLSQCMHVFSSHLLCILSTI